MEGIAPTVNIRPGNIRVFMYPGRVCNFQAGTRITQACAEIEDFCDKKQDENKVCRNSRIPESEMYHIFM